MLLNLAIIFGIAMMVVALFMAGLKLKQMIKPGSGEIVESCALETGELNEDDACAKCEIKELINCPEDIQQKKKQSLKNST